MGDDPVDPGQLGHFLGLEAFVLIAIRDVDPDDVVRHAVNPPDLCYFLKGRDGGFKVLDGLTVSHSDLNRHDHAKTPARGDRINHCTIAGNHSLIFQALDTTQARRGSQAHPACELKIREAPISRELK